MYKFGLIGTFSDLDSSYFHLHFVPPLKDLKNTFSKTVLPYNNFLQKLEFYLHIELHISIIKIMRLYITFKLNFGGEVFTTKSFPELRKTDQIIQKINNICLNKSVLSCDQFICFIKYSKRKYNVDDCGKKS